jgi:uncharacterized damage-inducible protein DinB
MGEIRAARQDVEAWIRLVGPDRWQAPYGAAWTNQDLLGHLAAWSDLLIDQVEALHHDRPGDVEAVEVDRWNASQVARRRERTADQIVEEWRRAAQRAIDVVGSVPAEAWGRSWRVSWSAEPVSIGDLLRLWLRHIEHHRAVAS